MAEIKKEVLAEYMLATIKDEEHSPEWRSKRIKHIYHLNADVNARLYGKSMLSHAKERGEEEVVKFLEEKGAEEWKISKEEAEKLGRQFWGEDGCFRDEKSVINLIREGADVNQRNEHGFTVLMKASQYGYEESVKMLIENNVDVNAIASEGTSMWSPLIYASYFGHKAVVELLINNGADVDACGMNGDTALIRATQVGCKEICEMLINNGAKVNLKDTKGRTALMKASLYGHKEIVECLLDNGARVDFKDNYGDSALRMAKLYGDKEITKMLEKHINKNQNQCKKDRC